MNTKLVSRIIMERGKALEMLYLWREKVGRFLRGEESSVFDEVLESFQQLLRQDWIVLKGVDLIYSHRIKAAWLGLQNHANNNGYYGDWSSGAKLGDIRADWQERYAKLDAALRKKLDLPSEAELARSFHNNLNQAPFALFRARPAFSCNILYQRGNVAQGRDCDRGYGNAVNGGYALPLVRLTQTNRFDLSDREVLFRFLALGWLPRKKNFQAEFTAYEMYKQLLQAFAALKIENCFEITALDVSSGISFPSPWWREKLLWEDTWRADLEPYNPKILSDTNLGHWSLWPLPKEAYAEAVEVELSAPLVARDPRSLIVDGLVGIDFGTKSTVVVYQKDTVDIFPMRIGTGKLSQQVERSQYENPTVMELLDLASFLAAYRRREGRPFTEWEDLTISHTAANSMLHSNSEFFNTFISEIKQWAGDKRRKLKLVDRKNHVFDLPPFLELGEEDVNPIELYAYYLGLYINNLNNGIFLHYTLSFPVTYEKAVREKIIESFRRGIRKSLPPALHAQMDVDQALKVYGGASEPAAYAAVALREYGFDPEGDEKVFYGVFDFGGGTTDFDFGIFREANGRRERRYDYVIEHFGAGGDRFLGGENLLEMLAYAIFKENRETLLEQRIQFTLPPEGRPFVGSEPLIAATREARINTKALMEKLRPFWEGAESHGLDEGLVSVNLFNRDGTQLTNVELVVDAEALERLLMERIRVGVENFFNGMRKSFGNSELDLSSVEQVQVFLAGNASKSRLLAPIFEEEIAKIESDIRRELHLEEERPVFTVHPPLAGEELDRPNGKTGVAFGLIETRKGGDILVIDRNNEFDEDICFRFYLGDSRKGKFKVMIDREHPYRKWKEFIDAMEDSFEIFYSASDRVSTNRVPVSDASVKKKLLSLDVTDEDAFVYIRLIDPTTIEYVVAREDGLENEQYLAGPVRLELS